MGLTDYTKKIPKPLFDKVMNHMKWSHEKTMRWFTTENPHFGGCRPLLLIALDRTEKLERWVDAMIDEDGG